jgi:hypothetical protein
MSTLTSKIHQVQSFVRWGFKIHALRMKRMVLQWDLRLIELSFGKSKEDEEDSELKKFEKHIKAVLNQLKHKKKPVGYKEVQSTAEISSTNNLDMYRKGVPEAA